MQRPYRNFVPLKKGLLYSTCKQIIFFKAFNNFFVYIDLDWREPRKHLNFAFSLNVLKGFIPIFSSYSDLTVYDMDKHVGGSEFDVYPLVNQLVLRTVSGILNLNFIASRRSTVLCKKTSQICKYFPKRKKQDSLNSFFSHAFKCSPSRSVDVRKVNRRYE